MNIISIKQSDFSSFVDIAPDDIASIRDCLNTNSGGDLQFAQIGAYLPGANDEQVLTVLMLLRPRGHPTNPSDYDIALHHALRLEVDMDGFAWIFHRDHRDRLEFTLYLDPRSAYWAIEPPAGSPDWTKPVRHYPGLVEILGHMSMQNPKVSDSLLRRRRRLGGQNG